MFFTNVYIVSTHQGKKHHGRGSEHFSLSRTFPVPLPLIPCPCFHSRRPPIPVTIDEFSCPGTRRKRNDEACTLLGLAFLFSVLFSRCAGAGARISIFKDWVVIHGMNAAVCSSVHLFMDVCVALIFGSYESVPTTLVYKYLLIFLFVYFLWNFWVI